VLYTNIARRDLTRTFVAHQSLVLKLQIYGRCGRFSLAVNAPMRKRGIPTIERVSPRKHVVAAGHMLCQRNQCVMSDETRSLGALNVCDPFSLSLADSHETLSTAKKS